MYTRIAAAASAAALVLLSLGGCGASKATTDVVATGVVAVHAGMNYPNVHTPDGRGMLNHAPGAACVGAGAYADARPGGGVVTIYGANGDIVGTGHLVIGKMVTQGSAEYCVMPFQAALNSESDAYQAEYGDSGRITVEPSGLGEIVLNVG